LTKHKILKNISWLFFDKIIRILGGLFVGIWIARYLGPSDFGLLNYAIAYTTLFAIFVNLGLNGIVVREIVKRTKLTNYLLGTAFGLKLIGSFVAIFAITVSLFFIDTDKLTKTLIYFISIGFIFQSLNVIDFFYQSKVLSKYVVVARNSAFIISIGIKIFLILYEYSVIYFVIASLIEICLSSIFLILIYKQTGEVITQWRFSKKIAKELLQYSWSLALSIFLISIHMKIDQIMIGNMLNSEQVGVYSVAVRLAEYWYFIPGILVSTLMPYFVKLRKENKKLYEFRLMQLYSLMFWMGVSVGIIVIFFGEYLIILLFGEAYAGAYKALIFNIWNGIFVSQAVARGIWLISEDLQRYRLYNNIIIVNLNIIINLILIPQIGIAGAAIATLLTQSIGTWVVSFLWKPLRNSTFMLIKSVNPIYLVMKYER
jgi:O-antigen/teichoic acid export membrane protein